MTALEQILTDDRYAWFVATHVDLAAACAHVREAADRLKLPPPTRMTVAEMQEATTCTGCVADLARSKGHLVRVIAGSPACPTHGHSHSEEWYCPTMGACTRCGQTGGDATCAAAS